MTEKCPVCGSQCRIMGDPSSVTRWYEPVEQAELVAVQDHALSLEKLIESVRTDRNAATERIVELVDRIKVLEASHE